LYKASIDIVRLFNVLSIYILRIFNAYISETDMKESSDADWMSVRLKEKIVIALLIKLTFIQNVTQNKRNLCVTQSKRNLQREVT